MQRTKHSLGRIHRSVFTLSVALAALAGGCGGGSERADNGPEDLGDDMDASLENPGFPVPTAVTAANVNAKGTWSELGAADWTCLDTPSVDQPSTQTIALTGVITDIQTDTGLEGATVTAFPGISVGGNSGTATSSNQDGSEGEYAMNLAMLPVGETRFGFAIEATGYVKTYVLNQYFDPAMATQARDLSAISISAATGLPILVGESRDVSTASVLGSFRDCAGRPVSNAVVTVSTTSGTVTHVPGAQTFYFGASEAGTPVRHEMAATMNQDGRFLVLNVTPTSTAYLQVWGFVNPAALAAGTLELLAEQRVPIEANTIVTSSVEALRAD